MILKDYLSESHAAAYADIAARCAWLVYHYPNEYLCATLNSYLNKAEKVQALLHTCQKKGVTVLRPDVNCSQDIFTVEENGSIRYGLKGIRNLNGVSDKILSEREKGPFDSMQNLIERLMMCDSMDKKVIEALIYSSAIDSFDGTRHAKIEVFPLMLEHASKKRSASQAGQMSLFDSDSGIAAYADFDIIQMPNTVEFDMRYLLEKEQEYSGFYITAHPLDSFPDILNNKHIQSIASFTENTSDNELSYNTPMHMPHKKNVRIFAIMEDIVWRRTKKNQPFVTFTAKDKSGSIKCVAFFDCVDSCSEHFGEKNIVGLTGHVQTDDFGTQFIVDKVKHFA